MQLAIAFPPLSPDIVSVELFGLTLALRWYALAYIFGLLLGWRFVAMLMARPRLWGEDGAPMAAGKTEDLLTWMVIGVVLGGRLGFVVFYRPDYYFTAAHWHEIPMIWEGGMAFHGGFLGVVLGIVAFGWRNAVNPVRLGDAVAAATPIGLFFGRIANFINAELWGRPTDLPWGVVFPGTGFAPDPQVCAGIAYGACARHPSQLYEAVLEGLLLFAVMLWAIWRRRALARPGLAIGIFLAGYGAGRTLVEYFRQADPQFITPDNPAGHAWRFGTTPEAWGFTMGQVLSLPMLGIGLLVLAVALLRPARAPA